MGDIIKEGLDAYWKAVLSATDKGLDKTELRWKRQYERDRKRLDAKYGPQYDEIFGKKD